jgi:hypothetical protein
MECGARPEEPQAAHLVLDDQSEDVGGKAKAVDGNYDRHICEEGRGVRVARRAVRIVVRLHLGQDVGICWRVINSARGARLASSRLTPALGGRDERLESRRDQPVVTGVDMLYRSMRRQWQAAG